jgi:hypothetical protein
MLDKHVEKMCAPRLSSLYLIALSNHRAKNEELELKVFHLQDQATTWIYIGIQIQFLSARSGNDMGYAYSLSL